MFFRLYLFFFQRLAGLRCLRSFYFLFHFFQFVHLYVVVVHEVALVVFQQELQGFGSVAFALSVGMGGDSYDSDSREFSE